MKRLLSITVLLVVFAACQKKITNEVLQSKSLELSKVAPSQSVYPIASHLWASLPVPITGGNDPAGPNKVIQVNGQVFCKTSHNDHHKLNNSTRRWEPIDAFFFTVEAQHFFSYESKLYIGMHIYL